MSFTWDGALRAAGAAVAASAVLAAWSAARAFELEPLPGPAESRPVQGTSLVEPRRGYPSEVVVAAALEDPFRAAPVPVPVEGAAPLPSAMTPAAPDPGAVRLVGTMLFPDGRAAAVCRVGSEPARMVRVGERVGAYTLARVEPGRAILTGPRGRLELSVPKPGA